MESKEQLGQAFGQVVKMPASLGGVPGFDTWLWLLTPASCKCRPGEATGMAQVTGSLPPTWETWTEFLASSLAIVGICE